ncbi:MAG: ABC transporter permease [Candidatus Marinimicrobia bacterium]|nr:ABC transporter permease [Candidatus Neomarinimicrobiota bacterium]
MKIFPFKTVKNRSLFSGHVAIGLVFLFLLLGPILTLHDHTSQDLSDSLQAPSSSHWMGTDYYGRDVFSRLVYGGRITWTVAILSTFIAVLIGTVTGLFSAYWGGWFDLVVMRLVDVMLAFPRLFVVLLIIGLGASSINLLIWALALFSWMEIARIVRSEVMSKKNLAYVKSARALGFGTPRILFKHILPNILSPVIVSSVLLISTIILVESGLSFLGLGIQAPNASWGSILNDGKIDPLGTWWLSVPAGFLILTTVVGFNLIGDGLQKQFDPKKSL